MAVGRYLMVHEGDYASPGQTLGPVSSIVEEVAAADKHALQWNGKDPAGHRLPPGTCFWKVQVGNQVATRKVVMVR